MKGWKTYLGAILIGAGFTLDALGMSPLGEILKGIGATVGVIGLGHKIEKGPV